MDGCSTIDGDVIVLFRDRMVTFTIYVLSIVTSLAVNDYIRLLLKEKTKDSKALKEAWDYMIIMIFITILTIGFFAWIFRVIKT